MNFQTAGFLVGTEYLKTAYGFYKESLIIRYHKINGVIFYLYFSLIQLFFQIEEQCLICACICTC